MVVGWLWGAYLLIWTNEQAEMRSFWFIAAEPQDECISCGKLYLLTSSSSNDGASVVSVVAAKGGLCKKCNVDIGGLSDKDSAYSNKHESEEEEEMEELEGEEEDAYLEVIDWRRKLKQKVSPPLAHSL